MIRVKLYYGQTDEEKVEVNNMWKNVRDKRRAEYTKLLQFPNINVKED